MKFLIRIVTIALLAIGAIVPAQAQNSNYSDIWRRSKSFRFAYVNSDWTPKGCGAFTSNYGFSITNSNTYFVHKQPIAGMIKFGIEATWFDITYVNYKANPDWSEFMKGDDTGNKFPIGDDELNDPNLGSHQIDTGLGIGLSANIAPFSRFDNSARHLRAKIYGNFLPSFSMMLISEPDDTRFNYAFVPYLTCGLQVQWKLISFFVEGRWGSANYKIGGLNEDNDLDEDFDISQAIKFDKVSCKNSGVRFGLALTF